jgi:hypothetical protein
MPAQSVRRSNSRSTGRRGIATAVSSIIGGVSAAFCQKIHSQCPVSEYHPSTALPMFCEKTKRNT